MCAEANDAFISKLMNCYRVNPFFPNKKKLYRLRYRYTYRIVKASIHPIDYDFQLLFFSWEWSYAKRFPSFHSTNLLFVHRSTNLGSAILISPFIRWSRFPCIIKIWTREILSMVFDSDHSENMSQPIQSKITFHKNFPQFAENRDKISRFGIVEQCHLVCLHCFRPLDSTYQSTISLILLNCIVRN